MSSSSGQPVAIPNSAKPRNSSKIIQSPKDRIDSILATARERREEMARSGSVSGEVSPQATPARTSALRGSPDLGETESSADEETSIVRKPSRQNINYQGTAQTQVQSQRPGIKSKPSTTSIRRAGRVYDPNENGGSEETDVDEHESWWVRVLSNYGSIELENKGSVARDHLALERTFLAWLRTSLAFASIGIAITQLFRLNTASAVVGGSDPYQHLRQMGKPLGATFLGISIVILSVGFHRYFESQFWIIRGKFPASRGSIAIVTAITFALMVTSLVVVVVVEPRAFEKR